MMMKISERCKQIEQSETLRVKGKALELKQKGIDVIDLTAGEPDFPTPKNIRDAGIQAINEGFTKYTANTGIPELRKAIVEKLKKENDLIYTADQIIVSAGAKPALSNAVLAIVEDGDEVIIVAPYWVSYLQQVRLANASPVIIDTSQTNFKLTPEALESHISPKTRLLMFNSPSNPTGIVYSPVELEALSKVLAKYDIWILSDEIYEKIIYDSVVHKSFAQFPELFEKTAIINGVSKAYSMTGWRIGYTAGPKDLINAIGKIQSHYAMAPSISQKAAYEALAGDQGEVERMRKKFEYRRNLLAEMMKQKPEIIYVYPQGAFYIFMDISSTIGKTWNGSIIEDSMDFCEYLIETQHLVLVPGNGFGSPNYLRMSFAASEEDLREGMLRLFRGLSGLQGSIEVRNAYIRI
jgi:aspartate aminotransferase